MGFKDNQILFLFSTIFLGCDFGNFNFQMDMKKFRKFVKYTEDRLFV